MFRSRYRRRSRCRRHPARTEIEDEAGHIACGDAMKSPTDSELYPGPIDMVSIAENEDVLIDENIDRIEWWDEDIGVKKVLPYESGSNVIDRSSSVSRSSDRRRR